MSALDRAFADAEQRLAALRELEARAEQAEREQLADDELHRLQELAGEDAATYPARTEEQDLDELVDGLRASARAAVFQNGAWAIRISEAADAIEHLRERGVAGLPYPEVMKRDAERRIALQDRRAVEGEGIPRRRPA